MTWASPTMCQGAGPESLPSTEIPINVSVPGPQGKARREVDDERKWREDEQRIEAEPPVHVERVGSGIKFGLGAKLKRVGRDGKVRFCTGEASAHHALG